MSGWFAAHEALIDVVLINILLGLGMYAVMTAGLISLAGAGLMAAGAYAGALASTRADISFPMALVLGLLAGGTLAAILSVPVIRLRSHYLAIATLAFSLVISAILLNWGAVSGGANGFITVPRETTRLWLVGAVGVAVVVLESVFRSETGRILNAIKNDEYLCRANGVYTGYYKFLALVASGMLSGVAGGLYAHYLGVLQPSDFREDRAFEMLSFTVLGGAWHWAGSVVGAVVLTSTPEFLRVFAEYRDILTGLVLLGVILVMPQGIVQPRPFRYIKRRMFKRRGARPNSASVESSGAVSKKQQEHRLARSPALAVRIDGIDKHFGGVYALRQVMVSLEPGLIYGLIGPNGSGKTTLLNIVNGFLSPDAGTIQFDTSDSGRPSPVRVARRGVARTFQEPRVLEESTVYANVLLGCHRLRNAGAIESSLQSPRARRENRAHDEQVWAGLAKVGLIEFAHVEAGELSFGQKRLVELARVLVSNAGLVVLDEPTAGVNPVMIERLAQWVSEPGAHRPTYLIAEHNIDFVMEVCDYVFVLDTGSILAEGLPHDVRVDERVIEAYLGVHGVSLLLEKVVARYQSGGEVLKGISLEVAPGEVVCLVGPNGAGKSSVLRAVSGFMRVTEGRILLDNNELTGRKPETIMDQGVAHVMQGRTAIPFMSVEENLRMGVYRLRRKRDRLARVAEIMKRFPLLYDMRSRPAGELSGGQQQLLELARALVAKPRVLLVDEPSLGLSPKLASEVFERVAELGRSGIIVLMVEQNVRGGLGIADRGCVLVNGSVRAEAPSEELLSSGRLGHLFLGGHPPETVDQPANDAD